jgi:hypothetical protein
MQRGQEGRALTVSSAGQPQSPIVASWCGKRAHDGASRSDLPRSVPAASRAHATGWSTPDTILRAWEYGFLPGQLSAFADEVPALGI